MYIHKIVIENVGNIKHEEIIPKQVTVFEGPNGKGKSLRIKSVRSCLTQPPRGKNFSGLLAEDAIHGSISLSSADVTITRELMPASSPLTVKQRGFKAASNKDSGNYIQEMFDAESVNAEAFLIEKPDERLRLILEAMPFEIDWSELRAIEPGAIDTGLHPLQAVDVLRDKIYKERTELNRQSKDKEKASSELYKSQPPEIDLVECDRLIAKAESEIRVQEERRTKEVESARALMSKRVETARSGKDQRVKIKREEVERKIEELRAELSDFEGREQTEFEVTRSNAQDDFDSLCAIADEEYESSVRDLNGELASWRGQRDTELKAKNVRELAGKYFMEHQAFKEQADLLTERIRKLDEFRDNMVRDLPIPGIEIRDGEIFLDGKAWDKVPDSRRCMLAIDLAIARSSDSGVLIIDALEKIDDTNFEQVLTHLQSCGRQSFVARATSNTPFRIRTLDALEPKKYKGKKKVTR